MPTNLKITQFDPSGPPRVGDSFAGTRAGIDSKFEFPGNGIQDANGNYLFQYATAGSTAVNYPKLTNSLTNQPVEYGVNGLDTDIDIALVPKGSGALILDSLIWPTADGALGDVITTDGAGNLSFSSVTSNIAAAPFITKTSTGLLSNEFALSTLGTGILKNTTTTGVPTISAPLTTLDGLSIILGDVVYGSAANTYSRLPGNTTGTQLFLSQTGTGVISAAPVWSAVPAPTGQALTKVDDSNVTLTLGGTPATALLAATSITAGWNGELPLLRGGTNANLTASNGGLVYSNASQMAILAGTATANQIPLSAANAAPSWSTATYPATTTVNQILYSSSANAIAGLPTANNSVVTTNGSGVPALTTVGTGLQIVAGIMSTTGAASLLPLTSVGTTTITMAVNNAYYCTGNASTLALPGGGVLGNIIDIYVSASTSSANIQITLTGSQQIFYQGQFTATGGSGGYVSVGNCSYLRLFCETANIWQISTYTTSSTINASTTNHGLLYLN